MKKILILLVVVLLCSSCVKENKIEESAPSTIIIDVAITPRENAVPLYEEPIEFESSWSIMATDGNAVSNAEFNRQVIDIVYPGENLEAITLYREGIPFSKGAVYNLSFNIESSINRKVGVYASDENGSKIFEETLDIGGYQNYSFDIKMDNETTWNGKIGFNLGTDGSEGVNNQHQVTISDLMVKTDDVDTRVLKVNQVGYHPNSLKKFIAPYSVGDFYNVVDTKTNEVVYTGVIGGKKVNDPTGETTFYGDFKDVITPGTYRIEAQIVATSYEFIIESFVYDGLLVDAIRMMTLQRCGDHLDQSWAKEFARDDCHSMQAIIYGTQEKIDVSGGWHDAGDYGRYIKTGAKAVADLLLAYKLNPHYFLDNFNIKESGNGIPDLLDEARYELEWMLKMQTGDGGVYNKVVSDKFPGYLAPEDDYSTLYVLGVSTNATGSFAGVMGLAYTVFKDIDPEFANRCLDAGKKAWEFLNVNYDMIDPLNPEGFDAGEYRDDFDGDERFFASMSLWDATNDQKYLDKAKELFLNDNRVAIGLNWQTVGTYGEFIYLNNIYSKNDVEFYDIIYNHFMAQADSIMNFSKDDSYFVSIGNDYNWGSNMDITNNGMLLMLADRITPNDNYLERAFDHLHYVLGRNSLNMSFVTGYGDVYPKDIHNRMVIAKKYQLIGAMVGGPNRNFEDMAIREKISDTTPSAKVYIDNNMSYSTNEVAVYWNSSLIFLISSLRR